MDDLLLETGVDVLLLETGGTDNLLLNDVISGATPLQAWLVYLRARRA